MAGLQCLELVRHLPRIQAAPDEPLPEAAHLFLPSLDAGFESFNGCQVVRGLILNVLLEVTNTVFGRIALAVDLLVFVHGDAGSPRANWPGEQVCCVLARVLAALVSDGDPGVMQASRQVQEPLASLALNLLSLTLDLLQLAHALAPHLRHLPAPLRLSLIVLLGLLANVLVELLHALPVAVRLLRRHGCGVGSRLLLPTPSVEHGGRSARPGGRRCFSNPVARNRGGAEPRELLECPLEDAAFATASGPLESDVLQELHVGPQDGVRLQLLLLHRLLRSSAVCSGIRNCRPWVQRGSPAQ
mmetsp:Transcript_1347/g.3768  ORF Transcript_1347/g.3768 Transcript_1347/m.3768 type:complete len:301 (+) Transcript_1347:295-1197(+)